MEKQTDFILYYLEIILLVVCIYVSLLPDINGNKIKITHISGILKQIFIGPKYHTRDHSVNLISLHIR